MIDLDILNAISLTGMGLYILLKSRVVIFNTLKYKLYEKKLIKRNIERAIRSHDYELIQDTFYMISIIDIKRQKIKKVKYQRLYNITDEMLTNKEIFYIRTNKIDVTEYNEFKRLKSQN